MAPSPTTEARASLSVTLSASDGSVFKEFSSSNGSVELGRGHRASAAISDTSSGRFRMEGSQVMSSKQALLTWQDHSYAFLTDTDSTNGTFIEREGEQLRLKSGVAYRLEDGDLVTFGQAVLSSKPERRCEPTPLHVKVTTVPFSDDVTLSPPSRAERPTSPPASAVPAPVHARARENSIKRQQSTSSTASDEEDEDEEGSGHEWKQSKVRTTARGFGLSEEDLLLSQEESEVEVIMEEAILRTLDDKKPSARLVNLAVEESDNSDNDIVVVTTQAAQDDSDAEYALSDMQIDDDGDEDSEEEVNVVEPEIGERESSPEEVKSVSSSPSPSVVEDSPPRNSVKEEEVMQDDIMVEDNNSAEQIDSPPAQRLPSPVSPDQIDVLKLPQVSLKRSLKVDRPPSPVARPLSTPLRSRLDSFRYIPKDSPATVKNDFWSAPIFSSSRPSVDDDVASQSSHLPSPSASVDAVVDEAVVEGQDQPSTVSSNAGDWVASVFRAVAAEEDTKVVTSDAESERSGSPFEEGDDAIEYDEEFDEEEDIDKEEEEAEEDDEESEEDEDDFDVSEDLDPDVESEGVAEIDQWFDQEAIEDDEDPLAEILAGDKEDVEGPVEEPKDADESSQEVGKSDESSWELLTIPEVVLDAETISRKRTFESVDSSTSTDRIFTFGAGVNTSIIPLAPIPIAPLPKRRRIARDVGAVTLGFGLGVVATVAGLSALSGVIQAMDV